MNDRPSLSVFLTIDQRHLKRVTDQGLPHVIRQFPADNSTSVNIEHNSKVAPPLPCADVGKIGYPQLIRSLRAEVALYEIGYRTRCGIGCRRPLCLPLVLAFDVMLTHQTFHRATCHSDSFALELLPDLPLPADSGRLAMNTADLTKQRFITNRPG